MKTIQAIETRIATLQALLAEARTAKHYREVRAQLDQASEEFWTLVIDRRCLPGQNPPVPNL